MVRRRICSGIVIGVSVGLTTAIILSLGSWLIEWYDDHQERRDQVRYFAEIIEVYRDSIFNAEAKRMPDDTIIHEEAVRTYEYEAMQRHVRSALDGRASQLTFDEVWQLERVFEIGYPDPRWLSYSQIDQVFAFLESLDWLGLEPRPDY